MLQSPYTWHPLFSFVYCTFLFHPLFSVFPTDRSKLKSGSLTADCLFTSLHTQVTFEPRYMKEFWEFWQFGGNSGIRTKYVSKHTYGGRFTMFIVWVLLVDRHPIPYGRHGMLLGWMQMHRPVGRALARNSCTQVCSIYGVSIHALDPWWDGSNWGMGGVVRRPALRVKSWWIDGLWSKIFQNNWESVEGVEDQAWSSTWSSSLQGWVCEAWLYHTMAP